MTKARLDKGPDLDLDLMVRAAAAGTYCGCALHHQAAAVRMSKMQHNSSAGGSLRSEARCVTDTENEKQQWIVASQIPKVEATREAGGSNAADMKMLHSRKQTPASCCAVLFDR